MKSTALKLFCQHNRYKNYRRSFFAFANLVQILYICSLASETFQKLAKKAMGSTEYAINF